MFIWSWANVKEKKEKKKNIFTQVSTLATLLHTHLGVWFYTQEKERLTSFSLSLSYSDIYLYIYIKNKYIDNKKKKKSLGKANVTAHSFLFLSFYFWDFFFFCIHHPRKKNKNKKKSCTPTQRIGKPGSTIQQQCALCEHRHNRPKNLGNLMTDLCTTFLALTTQTSSFASFII